MIILLGPLLKCKNANCITTPKGGMYGFVCMIHTSLECEHANCTTTPKGEIYEKFCIIYTSLECEHANCTTTHQGGKYGKFCKSHSGIECQFHSTYIKPIIVVEETVDFVEKLKVAAIYILDKGKHVYTGLMGMSGLEEINQDTCCMIKADSTLEQVSHFVIFF